MLDVILPVFALIICGWLARYARLLPEHAYEIFNNYVYFISLPALMFLKMSKADLNGLLSGALLAVNASAIIVALLAVALIALAMPGSRKFLGLLFICASFGNAVYMGFPVVQLIYGDSGLELAAVIATIFNLIMFTVGFLLLGWMSNEGKGFRIWELVKNTVIWGTLLGICFSYANASLPASLEKTLELIGGTTGPLALFSLGMFIYGRRLFVNPVASVGLSAARLVAFPVLTLLLARWLGLGGLAFNVTMLEAFMPIAVTNFTIAQHYKLDYGLAAEAIVLSTLLSIPLLMLFPIVIG